MAPLTVSVPLPKKSSPSASSKPLQPPLPHHGLRWERVRERPTYCTVENNFVLTFRMRVEPRHVTYVAFTYPFSYRDLQVDNSTYILNLWRFFRVFLGNFLDMAVRTVCQVCHADFSILLFLDVF